MKVNILEKSTVVDVVDVQQHVKASPSIVDLTPKISNLLAEKEALNGLGRSFVGPSLDGK